MVHAYYRRSFVLGVAGLVGVSILIILVIRSFAWDQLPTLLLLPVWIAISVVHILRARPAVRVTSHGTQVQGIGAWQLAWSEIHKAQLTPAVLLIEPTAAALQRQSISTLSLWTRILTPGKYPRGAILLPQPRLDAEAWQVLRSHGAIPGQGAAPGPRPQVRTGSSAAGRSIESST